MAFHWLQELRDQLRRKSNQRRRNQRKEPYRTRPRVERLEDRTLPSANLVNVPQWISQGPNPIQNAANTNAIPNTAVGAIASVVVAHVSPSTQNPGGYVVYAGTVNGGVWRADNLTNGMLQLYPFPGTGQLFPTDFNQIQWVPKTDQQTSLAISSMTLDPLLADQNHLWVGTGSVSSLGFSPTNAGAGGPAIGLLKTNDGGTTWTNLGNHDLGGSPVMGVVITLGGSGDALNEVPLVASYGKGILYSLDSGQSFQTATLVNPNGSRTFFAGNATDIVADPRDANRFYAAVAGQGVFRSDDNGRTWIAMNNGLPDMTGSEVIRLAAAFNSTLNEVLVYVAAADSKNNLMGVFHTSVSPDGSTYFVEDGTPPSTLTADVGHFGLTTDPSDLSQVYVSGIPGWIYRVSASSGSWTTLTGSSAFGGNTTGINPHSDSRHFTFLNNNILLETDDGGIYGLNDPRNTGSTDGWVSLNHSLVDTEVTHAGYDVTTGFVTAGAWDNGTSVQSASGWQPLPNGGGDGGETDVAADGKHYYFADRTFYRDADTVQMASGLTPGVTGSGLNAQDQKDWVNQGSGNGSFAFAFNSTDPSRMLLGMTGVYESTSRGDIVVSVGPSSGMTGSVWNMSYGIDNADAAYFTTDKGQLWVRSKAGATFLQMSVPWAATVFGVRIVPDPDNYKNVYVLDSKGRVWHPADTGWTDPSKIRWTDLTDNLDGQQIFYIEVYDPTPTSQKGDSVLLAGTLRGVYRRFSTDADGCSWRPFGRGLPNAEVATVRYYPKNGTSFGDALVVGSLGRGTWTINNAGSAIAQPSSLLVVADEQATSNTIDMRLDPNNHQFLQVILDGRTEYDGPYVDLNSIDIYAANPQDAITIEDVPPCISVTTHGGTDGTVSVGKNGSVQGIFGTINISDKPALTTISVDDHADPNHQLVTLGTFTPAGDSAKWGYIKDLASGQINYKYTDTKSVTVDTGGGDVVDVLATGVTTNLIGTRPPGLDTTYTTVNIGDSGKVDGIVGTLNIENPPFRDTINIDDSTDTGNHTVTLGTFTPNLDTAWGYISDLAPAHINYEYADTDTLTLRTGVGLVTVDVKATGVPTNLIATTVTDGSSRPTETNVNVGDAGSVLGIMGTLNLENPAYLNAISVDDSADTSQPTFTLNTLGISPADSESNSDTWGQISGLPGEANINYEYEDTDSLTLKTSGGSTVNVLATGSDPFTGADINLVANGSTTVTLGTPSGAGHNMQNIFDDVHITGALVTAILDDSADTAAMTATFDRFTDPNNNLLYERVQGLSQGNVYLEDGIVSATIDGGTPASGTNSFTVAGTLTGTPLVLRTGFGQDNVNVLGAAAGGLTVDSNGALDTVTLGNGSVQNILPTVTVNRLLGTTNVVVDDSADTTARTATLTSTTLDGLVNTFFSPWLKYSNLSSLTIKGGTPLVSGIPTGGNTFDVEGTASMPGGTIIKTGYGTDTVNIGSDPVNLALSTLDPILGPVTVNGQGNSTLNINDEATSSSQWYDVSASQVLRYPFTFGQPLGTPTQTINDFNVQYLNVHGGSGQDIFATRSTLASTALTSLYGGAGANEFRVFNNSFTLDDIQGPLALHGSIHSFADVVDGFNTVGHTYILNAGLVHRDNMADITYDGVGEVIVATADNPYLGHTHSTVNIQSTSNILTGVEPGNGDTVTVGSGAGIQPAIPSTMTGIVGDLLIAPPYAGDKPNVILDDSGDTNSRQIVLGNDPSLSYLVSGLAGTSQIPGRIGLRLEPATPVTIKTGSGDDTFNVHDFTNIPALAIDGGGGTNTLMVSDQATTSQNWDIANSFIDHYAFGGSRPAVPQITYHNMATVTVNAGTAQDFIFVQSTAAGTTTIVNGGGGNGDYFFVENSSNSLDDIQGPLQTHDVNPYNLLVTDGGTLAPHNYTVATGLLQRDGIQPIAITFDSDVAFVLDASAGGGAVNVPNFGGTGIASIVVVTGDTVTIGSQAGQGLSGITADVVVEAVAGQTPHVVLDDSANTTPRTFDLSSDPFFGYLVNGHMDPVRGRIGLVLDPAAPVTIKGGPANVLFRVNDLTNVPALSVIGHPLGTTTLQGPNTGNTWRINGANAGTLDGAVSFAGVQNLTGGSASDAFQFQTGGSVAGKIDGGGGTNTLDYTAYHGDILVDLLLNTASQVGQGEFNIANVNGGQGNSLIVGDANANVLVGGAGRNVIIGDGGGDTIIGGGGFNMLVGGITVYDNQLSALQALMQYWDNPNATTLDQLVNPLKSKSGVTINGQLLIFNKNTVKDDGVKDYLSSNGGATWFIVDSDDVINNGLGPRQIDRRLNI